MTLVPFRAPIATPLPPPQDGEVFGGSLHLSQHHRGTPHTRFVSVSLCVLCVCQHVILSFCLSCDSVFLVFVPVFAVRVCLHLLVCLLICLPTLRHVCLFVCLSVESEEK
jgi:hypothetical protein